MVVWCFFGLYHGGCFWLGHSDNKVLGTEGREREREFLGFR